MTHSDGFVATRRKPPWALPRGNAATGGVSVLPDKPPRDRAAFPSVRFGLRITAPPVGVSVCLPDGERAKAERISVGIVMGKIITKLNEDKPISAVIKISAVLIADTLLRQVILPGDFLRFDKEKGYFIELFFGLRTAWLEEPLTFMRWLQITWNQNIRSLTISLFLVGIITLLLFRFRFTKAENFRLSRHTVVISLLCLAFAAIGYSHMMYNDFLRGTLVWQYDVTNAMRVIFLVALFEELIYRGFITNVLFRLKSYGLKTPAAIAISAVLFGLVHLESAIKILIQGGSIPIMIMAERTFSSIISGVSWATILYHKKDIVSLICIHAAHNLLVHSYKGDSIFTIVLYWTFYAVFIVCYPVFLIFKAKKNQEPYIRV